MAKIGVAYTYGSYRKIETGVGLARFGPLCSLTGTYMQFNRCCYKFKGPSVGLLNGQIFSLRMAWHIRGRA